jgi:hypothetical protein
VLLLPTASPLRPSALPTEGETAEDMAAMDCNGVVLEGDAGAVLENVAIGRVRGEGDRGGDGDTLDRDDLDGEGRKQRGGV